MLLQVLHDLFVDLLDVLLGRCKLFLEADLFLLELILGALSELCDEIFDLVGDLSSIHRVYYVVSIRVELGRENF